jgi:hypothetical protein
LNREIEKNNKFYKGPRKKNQNNEDQIGKYNTINLYWMIKLKTNKALQKDQEKKIEIKRKRLN